jgi:digeranylgeranylglycerophospholipid reductase
VVEADSSAPRSEQQLGDSQSYEVIIVGAGPAGLQAAIAAAERGASVLVFDKKTTIGLPIRCGEFLPCKEEMLELLPGSRDFEHLFEIPSDAITNTTERLRVFSPHGKCWEFRFKAYVLDRVALEQQMGREARELGAEIRLGRPVRVFQSDGHLKVGATEDESSNAQVVIAADGFPSMTATSGGLSCDRYRLPENVAINYQYVMDGLDIESDVTEMYMGTSIAPGCYGWIIPKSSTTANIGIGIRTTFKSGKWGALLDNFVHEYSLTADRLHSGKIRTMIADVLPVDGPVSKTYSDRILLVGDAAGMVMPTNGGGIPTAMVSGRIAGEVAALHVMKNEPLPTYEARWKKAFGHELSASTRMRRFADAFMAHDSLFDCAMRILGTAGIKKVVTCKIPSGIGPLMRLFGY